MFESKLPAVGTTIFTVMSELAAKYGAINLSQGFPDFEIDSRLKEFVKEGLDENQVQYAPMPGRLDLRQQIALKIQKQRGLKICPETEITITSGATQAIYSILATVINKGDEVILFDPAYDCYEPSIILNGGIPVHHKLIFPSYKIDWEAVAESITSSTKLILVNNPHNPCGTVWDKTDIIALEQIVQQNPQVMILSDEVYEHLQYDNEHYSVLASNVLRERSFVTYSFGKTFHVTGWKVGYLIAPPQFTIECRKIHQFIVFSGNNTMQYGLAKYMEHHNEWAGVANLFRSKRDLFFEALKPSKFDLLPCEGTYFCLLDYSKISDLPDVAFAKWLTQEVGVAVIPISVFYADKTDHKVVRVCFAKKDETLLKAAELLCKI